MTNRVYVLQGEVEPCCEAGDDAGIGLSGVPLALWAKNNLLYKNVTLRWWVADRPLTEAERLDVIVNEAIGRVESDFYGSYSELTGHLWTNEKFNVGGHDILLIMNSHKDRWVYIEAVAHPQ